MQMPRTIPNVIAGEDSSSLSGDTFAKWAPHDGQHLWDVARSGAPDVERAVQAAAGAQRAWAATPPVERGNILYRICERLDARKTEMAELVALETGKSPSASGGEVDGAIECGRFFAGEGQRLYGRTTTSRRANKHAATVRQPVGVAGLIIAANTPIANVAWKVFPALICGNGAVLKAAEDAPGVAWLFARVAAEAGLPEGVLNVVQGIGPEAGEALVAHEDVGVISFTGSTAVGRQIAARAGARLAKVSLELGGKNPLVVCDDADLDAAVEWAVSSAFSNAGQRCASGSRLIVFDAVYEEFRERMVRRTESLRLGVADEDDLGPVINERALEKILEAAGAEEREGATVLCGGYRLRDPDHAAGFYAAPTILEDVDPEDEISKTEIFGPLTVLYRVGSFEAALSMADESPYGLTASIHTRSWDRAAAFAYAVKTGVAVVNGGTYGSEPHMPFGGTRQSGNGSREPGTEALDVYSELKDLYFNVDVSAL